MPASSLTRSSISAPRPSAQRELALPGLDQRVLDGARQPGGLVGANDAGGSLDRAGGIDQGLEAGGIALQGQQAPPQLGNTGMHLLAEEGEKWIVFILFIHHRNNGLR
jgi:hypothetical protein